MRSLEEAEKSWSQLGDIGTLAGLKAAVAADSEPRISSGLRSICWKTFLLFKTLDRATWPSSLADSRGAYNSLRSHFLRAIEHPDEIESAVDPLSESEESPWFALRKDETLRAEIFQDVERCMPDNVYFRQPSTQNTMLDILFIFCKLNQDVGYRQGMHEVLAPILWVVERDAISPTSVLQPNDEPPRRLLRDVLDSRFVEHDAFTLFALVMQSAKFFYAPGEGGKISSASIQNDSPMLVRSRRIFEEKLPKADPSLAAHLTKIDIVPQIFLMRWIRLLFGREFALDDVLIMWDMIFAEDPSLELVNYICIAMLLRIRWPLIEADTNTAFTLLLKYPEPSEPPYTLVHDAVYLKSNLNPEGGRKVIAKYGKKAPPLVDQVEHRTSFPLPNRGRPQLNSPKSHISQPGGLEALIQDAAKQVYDRGERWGVTKVFRDAVGEVKKNVQALQAGQGAPRSGGREYRRPARVPTTPKPITSASDILRKVSALESRNKGLAYMLKGALSELWDYHKERSDHPKTDKGLMEALSAAIAKVQFVQVYLEDSTIPLPMDEVVTEQKQPEAVTPPERTSSAPPLPTSRTTPIEASTAESKLASPKQSSKSTSGSKRVGGEGIPTPPAIATNPTNALASPDLHSLSASPRSRPSIAQSSFSWILGQDERVSAFASASAHSSFPSDEKRRMARTRENLGGKGYLFGDEEEEKGSPTQDSKAKRKSSKSEQEIEEEIIDLGPLGKSAVS